MAMFFFNFYCLLLGLGWSCYRFLSLSSRPKNMMEPLSHLWASVAGKLAAVVRRKLRVADAVGIAVEAAEADEPVLRQRAAVEAVDPVAVIGAHGQPDVAVRIRSALAQNEVRRRAQLAVGEDDTGAALQDLGALDALVDAERARSCP